MSDFAYTFNGVGVNFHNLNSSNTGKVNVFIHGYSSIENETEREKMFARLSDIDRGRNILIDWDSGSIRQVLVDSLVLSSGVRHNPLVSLPLAMGSQLFSSYKTAEKNAENLAKVFPALIASAIHGVKCDNLNIAAHSLGARMTVMGLSMASVNFSFPLKTIVLMAGAVEWVEEPISVLQNENCLCYNLYSTDDMALRLKPDFEKNIGLNPIKENDKNVVNVLCNGYAHTDFWSALPYFFENLIV